MKKMLTILLAGALLFGLAGCQGANLKPSTGSVVEPSKPKLVLQKPPEGILRTPEGDVVLIPAGYHWTVKNSDGTETSTIADQGSRPLPKDSLKPVAIDSQYAETVSAPVPESKTYEPINSLGYLVTLDWEVKPGFVTYTCWPDTVWEDSNVPEEAVVSQDNTFYAKPGGYIYEFVATWKDTGAGYHGAANYYVYIVCGDDHSHQVATTSQIVEDPVTGYCGNTWTTLYIDGKEYGFMGSNSVGLTDLLINLDYDPDKVCRCMPQYRADTEFETNYHIHLDNAFVRCEKGQADLTADQVNQIREIVEWAKAGMSKA